jgi:hypothetical protein
MTNVARKLVPILIVIASGCCCTAGTHERSSDVAAGGVATRGQQTTGSVDDAIARTMSEARLAVKELGVSEAAMRRIETALSELARTPGLKERASLRQLHGGGGASGVLASDGEDDLTLLLARFEPGKSTPIHDHGSWAVAYVIEGEDRYTQWERLDDGSDPAQAKLRVKYERTLRAGDAVYWFDPPHDIHSQEAMDVVSWELLLFGKNPQQGILHYFDRESGRVTTRSPVAPVAGESGKTEPHRHD